jgi:hypothetical protein
MWIKKNRAQVELWPVLYCQENFYLNMIGRVLTYTTVVVTLAEVRTFGSRAEVVIRVVTADHLDLFSTQGVTF